MSEQAKVECTNSTCDATATRVMAMAAASRCLYAAPYCDEHAVEVTEMGGLPVSGPALSDDVRGIEGIRIGQDGR